MSHDCKVRIRSVEHGRKEALDALRSMLMMVLEVREKPEMKPVFDMVFPQVLETTLHIMAHTMELEVKEAKEGPPPIPGQYA